MKEGPEFIARILSVVFLLNCFYQIAYELLRPINMNIILKILIGICVFLVLAFSYECLRNEHLSTQCVNYQNQLAQIKELSVVQQKKIDDANVQVKAMQAKEKATLASIENKPIPADCVGAMIELGNFGNTY